MSARVRLVRTALAISIVGASATGARELDGALLDPRSSERVALPLGERITHVVFFATWCPACLDEFEGLADLRDRWSDRGYGVVRVAVQARQTAERIARFGEQRTIPGRLLLDVDGKVERHFNAARLPTHLLLDERGSEIFRADRVDAVGPAIERRLGGARRAP